jgi:hypothetical protein
MSIRLALVLSLSACGSVGVSNHDGGPGGDGDGGGGGGVDAPPVKVQAGLVGDWAVTIDGTQECIAHVGDTDIDVDCGTSTSNPVSGCTETRSSHLVGSWLEMLDVNAEERYSYSGCDSSIYVDHVDTEIDMTATRTTTSTATGVWQEAAGEWHYLATDPTDVDSFIDCTGTFTPAAGENTISVDCFTAWTARTDMPQCQEHALFQLVGAFTGDALTLQFTSSLERQGDCGTLPGTEPGDAPIDISVAKM